MGETGSAGIPAGEPDRCFCRQDCRRSQSRPVPPEVVGESPPDDSGPRTWSPQPLDVAAGHGTSESRGRRPPLRVENPRSEPITSGGTGGMAPSNLFLLPARVRC
jgi:hypothetical protein